MACEVVNRRKGGSLYWTRLQILPWHDAQGVHQGFVSVQVDSTRQRETLESALAARQNLLSKFTHELRTPLNAIIQLNDLLSQMALSPEQQEICQQSHVAAQGLLSLVNDMLNRAQSDFQALQEPLKPTNLSALLSRVRQVFEAKGVAKEVELRTDAPSNMPTFSLQEGRVYRVLLNLLSNALKYTREGAVTLSVEARPVVRTGPAWDLRFCVSDTGIGMDEWQVQRLMQPFARVHSPDDAATQGTGLGLLVCDETLRAMGSMLQIHSAPGAGSQFWFTLAADAVDASDVMAQAPVEQSGVPLAGWNILVVDDNPIGLSACVRQLRRLGAQVQEARTGEQAVALVQASSPDSLHAVLMDIQMPGIDGFEATRQILHTPGHAQLPVLGLTAGFIGQSDAQYREAGMRSVVTKPFSIAELVSRLVEVVPARHQQSF
jgi:signal transduction histidine kinase/CheY-like chemotaxis protein